MTVVLPVTDPSAWGPALDRAVGAVGEGSLIVLPTDTVYGVGADPFDVRAVAALLAAKGRGRSMPPPVLVPGPEAVEELAAEASPEALALADASWPGALTIIVRARPEIRWDLGETGGTVALRMPDHPAALALLRRTGPLAVSSANRTGRPAARTVTEAREQLEESVAVYLDGGPAPGGVASTIVDATGAPRLVRAGALGLDHLRRVVPCLGAVE